MIITPSGLNLSRDDFAVQLREHKELYVVVPNDNG